MPDAAALASDLLQLSRDLGREDRSLAILGEGNASARISGDEFWVKASGHSLATLEHAGLARCRVQGLLALLKGRAPSDARVETALLDSRVDASAPKPSVESMVHAWLLTLPGVSFVGHTHPVAVNAVLCSPKAGLFARRRMFPDEIVGCGPESVLVDYVDPGLALARAIRVAVEAHRRRLGLVPRVILLRNHGLIALGATSRAVLASTLMAVKSAEIFIGASALGGPKFLPAVEVARIAGRSDEHYRQRALGLQP